MMRNVVGWKKAGMLGVFVLILFTMGIKDAYALFDVDWRLNRDDGLRGYQKLAQWMVDNGYYQDYYEAWNFSQFGFIGYDREDPDPFKWNLAGDVKFEVVKEVAGFADENRLGFYTGSDQAKVLTQIFSGVEDGPKTLTMAQSFGLYLSTPQNNTWFTDRAENVDQKGMTFNVGGDAQALVYELKPGAQWLVAWEDLDTTSNNYDGDYDDMYLMVSVVPEPVSSFLFVLGGGVLTANLRKRPRWESRS